MRATRAISLAMVAGLAGAQTFAAEHLVTVDAAYTSVFNLNGDGTAGDYVFGTGYGELNRAQIINIAAGSADLGPNYGFFEDVCLNGTPDEFWCGPDFASGTYVPNKYVGLVGDGPVPGQPQFTVTADVSGIPAGYNAQLSAIGFTADYSGNYAFPVAQTLTADGTLTATIDFTAGTLVNYRAQIILNGPIISPADAATVGYMNVTNFKVTYPDPTAPTGVAATGSSDGSFLISWTGSTVPPATYLIQQSDGSGSRSGWVDVASVPWTQTSYTASTSLDLGDSASFRVVASGAGGVTASSSPVTSSVPLPREATPVPVMPLWALLLLGALVGLFGYRRITS